MNQRSVNDCGVACLTGILNFHGINVSYDEVRSKIKLEKEGVSAYEIIKVARTYGLTGNGYKNYEIEKNSLFPFIAHIINNKTQHFVVVRNLIKDTLYVDDPSKGELCIKIDDFNKIYTGIAILFKKEELINLKTIINKKYVILISMIILFLSFLNVFYSYCLSYLVENFKRLTNVFLVIILFLLIGLLKEFINFVKNRMLLKYQIKTDKLITIPSLKKIINLPHKFYQERSVGELMAKINDLSYVKQMSFLITEVLFVNVIVMSVSFIFLLCLNKYIFIFNLLIVIFIFLYNKHFYFKNAYKNYDLQIKNESLSKTIAGGIESILSIKNLCKEKFLENKVTTSYKETIKSYKSLNLLYQNKDLIFKVFSLVSLVISMTLIIGSNGTVSELLFMTYLASIIYDSLDSVCELLGVYTDFKAAFLRLKTVLKEPGSNSSFKLINIDWVSFKNLSYKTEDKSIFKNVNLTLKKGELAMINGPSGSGKTTLFKILTGQVNNFKNKVFINGMTLNDFDDGTLRKNITYVDQKVKFLNDSIIENITLGTKLNLRPSFKKLLNDCLRVKNIGYDDVIDNTNSNLSGGELSLILIAQALNNAGSMIIFDETTSSMDALLERKVILAIKKDYKDKVLVFISHRKSNMDLFDKIYNFPDKKIRLKRRTNESIKRKRIKTN